MVKNRAELVSMSKEWTKRAMSDLRGQIISFMENVGTDSEELAYALGITVDELNAIISGCGEISLSTFAKILIATDNVIEIKPINATPFGRMEEMPNPSMLPIEMRSGKVSNERKHVVPQMTTPQPRDSKGRFTKAKPNGSQIPSYDEFLRMMKNGEIPEPTERMRKMHRMAHGMPIPMPMDTNGLGGMPSIKKMNPRTATPQPRDSKGRFTKAKPNGSQIPSYDEFLRMMKNGEIPEPTERMRKMHRMAHGMPIPMPMDTNGLGGMPSIKKMNPRTATPQLEVPRRELVSTIVDNGWDDQIDIMNSTSAELMEFLMSMGLTPSHFERMKNESTQNNPINESKKEHIMQMLSDELDKNPHLLEQIRRFTDAN